MRTYLTAYLQKEPHRTVGHKYVKRTHPWAVLHAKLVSNTMRALSKACAHIKCLDLSRCLNKRLSLVFHSLTNLKYSCGDRWAYDVQGLSSGNVWWHHKNSANPPVIPTKIYKPGERKLPHRCEPGGFWPAKWIRITCENVVVSGSKTLLILHIWFLPDQKPH